MKDYYKILGVAKSASDQDIKKAYHRLAHKFHPDKSSGDSERFKEINEAYQILSNPEKRNQYDRFGTVFEHGAPGGGAGDFSGVNFGDFGFGAENLRDIFEEFFGADVGGFGGGQSKRKGPRSGRDITVEATVSLKDSYTGKHEHFSLRKYVVCEHCTGRGAEPGSTFITCPECRGSGEAQNTRRTMFGIFSSVSVCPKCAGEGKIPEKPCKTCRGSGRVMKEAGIDVQIPSGIRNGELVRITGQGEAGEFGAASGDLYIRVLVRQDPRFIRKEDDLVSTFEINFTEAVFGAQKSFTHLDGENIAVTISSGSESADVIKVKGKGMRHLKGGSGDLLLQLKVKTPKKLSNKAKELLKELEKEL